MRYIEVLICSLLHILIICSCERLEYESYSSLIENESYKSRNSSTFYEDSLTVLNWNIGHFSGGLLPESTIKEDSIIFYLDEYYKLLNSFAPDVIAINEYSSIFGEVGGEELKTRDVLFDNYNYAYVGLQNMYSCNAVFSNIYMYNVKYNTFLCNDDINILQPSIIESDDYYYISSLFQWKGKTINFVVTHLAYDATNNKVVRNQIKELIRRFSSDECVIMCGDWNASIEEYELFEKKGYELVNCGEHGQFITHELSSKYLDNIVIKGCSIADITVVETDLSDHFPILCTVYFNE